MRAASTGTDRAATTWVMAVYGHIDGWLQSGERHTLEGDWGCVVIDDPVESIEYLD